MDFYISEVISEEEEKTPVDKRLFAAHQTFKYVKEMGGRQIIFYVTTKYLKYNWIRLYLYLDEYAGNLLNQINALKQYYNRESIDYAISDYPYIINTIPSVFYKHDTSDIFNRSSETNYIINNSKYFKNKHPEYFEPDIKYDTSTFCLYRDFSNIKNIEDIELLKEVQTLVKYADNLLKELFVFKLDIYSLKPRVKSLDEKRDDYTRIALYFLVLAQFILNLSGIILNFLGVNLNKVNIPIQTDDKDKDYFDTYLRTNKIYNITNMSGLYEGVYHAYFRNGKLYLNFHNIWIKIKKNENYKIKGERFFIIEESFLHTSFKKKLCAAKDGNVDAQYSLAFCYEYGRGTDKSIKEALKWYEKAANGGDIRAKHRADHIKMFLIKKSPWDFWLNK